MALNWSDNPDVEVAQGNEVGFTDYLTDVPIGAVKGVSALVQGLLQLGAMPVDYAFDTNILGGIEKAFDAITPDTKTVVGDVTSVLVQFGIPYGAALKIAGGMSKLKGVSQMTPLASITTRSGTISRLGQTAELAKRAGYFGGIGAVTDFAVSTPEKLGTLSDFTGLTEQTDFEGLEGRDRALETIKGKLKFGAEGAVIGGGITLLGPGLSVGAKYGLIPTLEVTGKVLGTVGNVINVPISAAMNRLTGNIIKPGQTKNIVKEIDPKTGQPIMEEVAADGVNALGAAIAKGGALVDEGLAKIGAKKIDPVTGKYVDVDWLETPLNPTFLDDVRKRFQQGVNLFKTNRGLTAEVRQKQIQESSALAKEEAVVKRFGIDLQTKAEQIVDNFKVVFFRDKESTLRLDQLNNKIIDIINIPRKIISKDKKSGTVAEFGSGPANAKEYKRLLSELPKELREPVIKFKKVVDKADARYTRSILNQEGGITENIALDFGMYMKRRFASFQNKDFKFNPLLEKEVVNFWKGRVKDNANVMNAINTRAAKEIDEGIKSGKIAQADRAAELNKRVDTLIEENAKSGVLNFKKDVIKVRGNLEQTFRNIGGALGLEKKTASGSYKVSDMPEVMTKWLSIEEGRTIKELAKKGIKVDKDVITNRSAALSGLDVVMAQANQIYSRRAFDGILDAGLNTAANPTGKIYTKQRLDELSLNNPGSQEVRREFTGLSAIPGQAPKLFGDVMPEYVSRSKIFDAAGEGSEYYAKSELVNALVGAKEISSSLYSIPLYKQVMALKAAGQVSKTILSPMTQIRNFTTASMFPLASGLIGGRIGFKDAWRFTGEDIFYGTKNDAEKIARIEDYIHRGVVDQNINVQEMKRVLESAKDGAITFNKMMNSKVMQKLTDVYQGADNYWKIYADNFYQSAFDTAWGSAASIAKMVDDPAYMAANPKSGFKNKAEADFFKNVEDWFQTVAQKRFERVDNITGITKSPLDAMKEASAYLVTNTIPTYSKVPIIIENIRNLPLGNFIAFPAEILRTTTNIVSLGARELTSANPFIRQMGMRRLVGVSAVLGGIGYTTKKGAQYLTGVDNETMEAAQRSYVPSYQRNSTLIPVSSVGADGKFKYYNFSYSNPYDALVSSANAVIRSFNEGTLRGDSSFKIISDALFGGALGGSGEAKGALPQFLEPFVTESIGTERVTDVIPIGRGGKTRDGKVIYYANDTLDDKLGKSLAHVFGGVLPGAATSAKRVWEGATGQFTDYGTQRDAAEELVALMSGVRIEELKPLSSMPFILTSFNKDGQMIKSKFSKIAYSAARSSEQKLAAFEQYVLESYVSQSSMFQTFRDAQILGISSSKLKKTFGGRLTETAGNELLKGRFKPPTFSADAFESVFKRLKNEDPEEAAVIKARDKVVMDIFEDIQKASKKFPLNQPVEDFNDFIQTVLSPGVEVIRDVVSEKVAPNIAPVEQVKATLPATNVMAAGQAQILPILAQNNSTNIASLYGIPYNKMSSAQKEEALFGNTTFRT